MECLGKLKQKIDEPTVQISNNSNKMERKQENSIKADKTSYILEQSF